MNDPFASLDLGTVVRPGDRIPAKDLAWNPHPAFSGVALKHLLTGADTDGRMSLHLVRLEPGAEIGEHVHEKSWELHQVAGGSGQLLLDGRTVEYHPGVAAALPENEPHAVRAGENGLRLIATFSPPLL